MALGMENRRDRENTNSANIMFANTAILHSDTSAPSASPARHLRTREDKISLLVQKYASVHRIHAKQKTSKIIVVM